MVHAVPIAVLLWPGPAVRVQKFNPGTPHGARIELSYLPGGPASLKPDGRQSKSQRAQTPPVKAPNPELSRIASPLPPHQDEHLEETKNSSMPDPGGVGASLSDAMGTDNIQIALTTYSPSPKPDLSRLPRGTQGEVVLDVTIDPTGKIADLQVLHALGYGIDEPVVETVRTWMFRPATKDGVPVASIQELHFHFGPV
jgi:periplasmic protein TonB